MRLGPSVLFWVCCGDQHRKEAAGVSGRTGGEPPRRREQGQETYVARELAWKGCRRVIGVEQSEHRHHSPLQRACIARKSARASVGLTLDGDARELLGNLLNGVGDVVGLSSGLDEAHLKSGLGIEQLERLQERDERMRLTAAWAAW